jgi:LPS sulfotransferase NodH
MPNAVLNEDRAPRIAGQPYDLTTAAHDYPAWEGHPARTVLLCTHPRSGSTLLGEALYFARGLGCPLEYFHAGFRPDFAGRWDAPDLEQLSAAVRRHRTEPNGTMSVKLFWRDIEEIATEADPQLAEFTGVPPDDAPAAYYRALASHMERLFPKPSIVHLQRDDRLRQAISAVVAVDTGRWRSIEGIEGRDALGAPVFDAERIERLMGYSDYCHGHLRNLFAAMGVAPLAMSYEALTTDYSTSVGRVLAYLGSDVEAPAPRMRRQADAESEALVLRYLRDRAAKAGADVGPGR